MSVPGTEQRSSRRRRIPLWPAGRVVALVMIALAAGGFLVVRGGDDGADGAKIEDARGRPWRVEVSAKPAEARAGSKIDVVVSVHNLGEAIQSLTFSSNRQVALRAVDEDGRVVWRSQEPDQKFDLSRAVTPGAFVEYPRSWTTSEAKPGRYTFEASILSAELKGRATAKTSVVLR